MDGFKPYIPAPRKISLNGKRFHVFLSFRGKDVRKTLVDHLFQALSAAGLNVFLDSHKLKRGEIIYLSLENAIKSSAICIPIFSERYAGSAWCLNEAMLMLACPGLIIPLFYEMEPTHVRYLQGESGPYKKSFGKHYSHPDRHSRGEIDGWKNALQEICCRSGWSLNMTGSFEAQLSWHAFLRPFPIAGYEELSKRIVEAYMGHPLSLEIMGAFLYDKQDDSDIDCWNETLDNIAGNRDIFETLKISYSGLSAEEKEIFLDIACYFIGENTTSPIVFWKCMYKNVHTAITNLSMKLPVKIGEKRVFDMHDLVRDMGRIIAEEEQTRQWDAQSSSSFNKVSNISGLRFYKGDTQSLRMLCTPSLRYLHLEYMHIEYGIASLPLSLRWLKLDSCSFPIAKHRSNLFKDLILATKKKSTAGMGSISQLRIVDLTNCRSLQNLPETITDLSHLQSLNLSGCANLDCLPNTISNLSQLLYMNLSYCGKFIYLPDSIGNLSQLQFLNLTCCKILIELPDSIGKFSQLKHLSLSWCEKLESSRNHWQAVEA